MKNRGKMNTNDTEEVSAPVPAEAQKKIDRQMIVKIILTSLFAAISLAYWVIFYLWEFRNINIDYSIAELLGIGEFLIPIIAIIAIIAQIVLVWQKQDTKRNSFILAVLSIILISSVVDTYYTAHGVNSAVLSPIYDTVDDDGKYYIVLKHEYKGHEFSTKLRCDKDIYENVIVDEKVAYSYMYEWNTLTPRTGYLINFDLDDYCDNRNNWMERYFKERTQNKLSKSQLNTIKGSASVTASVAEDAGVKITLDSATGDGFFSYYKLDVELPKELDAGYGYFFDKAKLLINDETIGLGTKGTSIMSLDDGDLTDNRFSVLLSIRLSNYPTSRNYSFDNGIVRTLHLENIIISDESGKVLNLIEGQWDFGVLFKHESKAVELVSEPVTVSGYSLWRQDSYEAIVTSFVLSEFSAYCEYELTPNSVSSFIGLSPIAVMKDGSEYALIPTGGSNYNYDYYLKVPVSLDEVEYVRLTDDVILKMK